MMQHYQLVSTSGQPQAPGRPPGSPLPYTKWSHFDGRLGHPHAFLYFITLLVFTLTLTSCSVGAQQQTQPNPRLKLFHLVSARIIMLDNAAEVDGSVQNTGHDPFPYDVTIVATFYDSAGKVIGQAQGVAEDVKPGTIRAFILQGQVDSGKYSRMELAPVSLRERRTEQNLPTPTPPVP